MSKTKCLLLTTNDRRQFFTRPEYLPQLVEFSNTFDVQMSIVQVESPRLLELNCLAPAICEHAPQAPINVEIVEQIRPDNIQLYVESAQIEIATPAVPARPKREKKPKDVIRADIRKTFARGDIVDVKQLSKKYQRYRFKLCTFSNHVKKVRDQLALEGQATCKVAKGQYQIA